MEIHHDTLQVNTGGLLADDPVWQLFEQGRHHDALAVAGEKLRTTRALDAIHTAGLSLAALGGEYMHQAIDWICASLALADAPPHWFRNAAVAMMKQEQYAHAIMFLTNGINEHPTDLIMHYQLGLCYVHMHDFAKAMSQFDWVIQEDPAFYHVHLSKGFCMHMLGDYEGALAEYAKVDRSKATPEDMEEIDNNICAVLLEMNRPREALAHFEQYCPGSSRPGTLFNLSILHIGLGNWPYGWHLYQHRKTTHVAAVEAMNLIEQPIATSLFDVADRRLLFFHEQGFGDTIQFVRYAKRLVNIAGELVIGVPPQLVRLMNALELDKPFEVISTKDAMIGCDVAMPMLDAPMLFDQNTKHFPSPVGFKINAALAQQRWIGSGDGKLRVGLVWAGAARTENIRAHAIDRRRSIPFELVSAMLLDTQWDNVEFISLHLSDHHRPHPKLRRVLEDDFDMLDTAAVIKQLDLVITIDSSVCHLAASMGVPTWMLSRYDACWRWLWESDDTTKTGWYPSMTIYRQPAHHTWPDVLSKVSANLMLAADLKKVYNQIGARIG